MATPTLLAKGIDYVNEFHWVTGETPFTSLEALVTFHVVYLSSLYALTNFMEEKPIPFWVRGFAFVHNMFMSVLSLVMLLGIVLGAYQKERFSSFSNYACNRTMKNVGLLPFSMYVFYLSKAFEFVDTFLLVLTKKKLIWLHKIHHLTTMSLVWHAMHIDMAAEITCGALNCFVHVIMYLYFASPINFLRPFITFFQIFQFVLALGVIGYASYVRYFTSLPPCEGTALGEFHGIFMYGVYLAMFVNFFVQQYIRGSGKNAASTKTDETKQLTKRPDFSRVFVRALLIAGIAIICTLSHSIYLKAFGLMFWAFAMSLIWFFGYECKTASGKVNEGMSTLQNFFYRLPTYPMMREMMYWNRRDSLLVVALAVSMYYGPSATASSVAIPIFLCGFLSRPKLVPEPKLAPK